MSKKEMILWAILISIIAFFTLFSCERPNQRDLIGIDVDKLNQPISKNDLSASLFAEPDIIVNATLDEVDFTGAQQVADLPGPDGVVSLREAVTAANNSPGPNVIGFNIPLSDPGFDLVSGAFTIKLKAERELSLNDDGTTINGATQSDFTGNTNPAGPEIVLDGSENPFEVTSVSGINIGSSDNNIHCLVVINFWTGIRFGGNNNTVTGCFVGIDASGKNPQLQTNTFYGIGAQFGPSGLKIGGESIEERNIISAYEIGIFIEKVSSVTIENNYIGTDFTGKEAVGNKEGIRWGGAGEDPFCENVTIKNNLISGNFNTGIVAYYFKGLWIQGNTIGPDIDGNPMGNGYHGIGFASTINNDVSSNLQIGGSEPEDANIISGNGLSGIAIHEFMNDAVIQGNIITHNIEGIGIAGDGGSMLIKRNTIAFNNSGGINVSGSGTGYTISMNEIYTNQLLGIDLISEESGIMGVTPNDPGDFDTGPNNLMNFPVLSSAKITPGKLLIKGTIDTPNPKTVTIEFFANPVPNPGGDPSGHGEGAIYLGSDHPNPLGKITATLPSVAPGTLITATATDADGNTSEFALNIEAK